MRGLRGPLFLGALLICGCAGETGDGPRPAARAPRPPVPAYLAQAAAEGSQKGEYPVPPPPFTDGIFPCSDCHADQEPDPTRRALGEHTEIALDHGPRERWCFDCHDPTDRDQLRLASGARVPFTESYLLCGQCHGPRLRDWRVGVHGKRTGEWNGTRQYLLCAHCHDPHAPRFAAVEPMPPPPRPLERHQEMP